MVFGVLRSAPIHRAVSPDMGRLILQRLTILAIGPAGVFPEPFVHDTAFESVRRDATYLGHDTTQLRL